MKHRKSRRPPQPSVPVSPLPILLGTTDIAVNIFQATTQTLHAKVQMIYRLAAKGHVRVFRVGKRYYFDPRDFIPRKVTSHPRRVRKRTKAKP